MDAEICRDIGFGWVTKGRPRPMINEPGGWINEPAAMINEPGGWINEPFVQSNSWPARI